MFSPKAFLCLYYSLYSFNHIHALEQNVSLPEPLPLPPAKPDCFRLKDSHFCGTDFGEYFLSSKTIVNGVLTTDVVAFDRAMSYYFGSPSDVSDINTRFGCLGGAGWDGVYEPPYRTSFTCRSILKDSNTVLCNKDNPIPPLCQETCQRYTRGWATVIRNETACPAPLQEEDRKIADVVAWCDEAPFNGVAGQCISGEEDLEATCGFLLPHQFPYLCSFCEISKDSCCQSSSARECQSQSVERNVPILVCSIVFGCLGGIGLVVGVVLVYKRRRIDRRGLDVNPTKPSASTLRLNSTVSSISECVCEFPYRPTLPDELLIEPGDSILMLWVFDDGWAVGRNVTRGGEGAFPLVCVVSKRPDSAYDTTVSIDRVNSDAYPRRSSSKRSSNQPKSSGTLPRA